MWRKACLSFFFTAAVFSAAVPLSASAENVPTYGDFVRYLQTTSQWQSGDNEKWVFVYGENPQQTSIQNRYIFIATWSSNISVSSQNGADTFNVAASGNRLSVWCTGFSPSGEPTFSYNVYPSNRNITLREDQGYLVTSDIYTFYNPLKDGSPTIINFVTNVEYNANFPDIDIDYNSIFYSNVNYSPSGSISDVENSGSEPTEPTTGGGFELPSDWLADNTVPTEPTFNVEFVPSPSDYQNSIDNFKEGLSAVEQFTDSMRFWYSSLTKFLDSTTLKTLVVILCSLSIVFVVTWYIGGE